MENIMENIGFEIEGKFFFFGGKDAFSEEKVSRIKSEGVRFRCVDADGCVVSKGRFLGDIDALTAFSPLRVASGDGAIDIQYWRGARYETL